MTEDGIPIVLSPVQLVSYQFAMPPPSLLMGPPPPPPPITTSTSNGVTWSNGADGQGFICQQQQLHQQIHQQQQLRQAQHKQEIQQQLIVSGAVPSFNSQVPRRNNLRFNSHQRVFPYIRPPNTHTNDGFAVPWPPRARFNKNTGAAKKFKKGNEQGSQSAENKRKRKKKSLSEEYISTKLWNRSDAEKAFKVETELMNERREKTLIIRFPDPELSIDIVKRYHPDIKSVHFQAPSDQRFCYVHLDDDVNVDEAIESLSKIKFGIGYLVAERKPVTFQKCDGRSGALECIDPYTLYVGNLPANTTSESLMEHFPTSKTIKISQETRVTSHMWAFVAFETVDLAIEALRSASNLKINNRNIAVRFRRGAKLKLNSKNKDTLNKRDSAQSTPKKENEVPDLKKEPSVNFQPNGRVPLINDEYDEEQSVEDELDSVMGDYEDADCDDQDDIDFMSHPNGYQYNDVDEYDEDEEVMAFHSLPILKKSKTEQVCNGEAGDNNSESSDDDVDVWQLR